MDIKLSAKIIIGDSRKMRGVADSSVHLIVTSPPYFNAKTYSDDFSGKDLGNINDYEKWKNEIKKVWQGREHLAPFPLELPVRLIRAYSYITETVLDPFGGMGTTAKAAIQEQRNAIIYEINKSFLPLIKSNISENLFDKVESEIIYQ